jgi:hypothetical protein
LVIYATLSIIALWILCRAFFQRCHASPAQTTVRVSVVVTVVLFSTLLDKLMVLVVDRRERARIMGLLFGLVILLTTPSAGSAGSCPRSTGRRRSCC